MGQLRDERISFGARVGHCFLGMITQRGFCSQRRQKSLDFFSESRFKQVILPRVAGDSLMIEIEGYTGISLETSQTLG